MSARRVALGLLGLCLFAAVLAVGIYGTTQRWFQRFVWFDETLHTLNYFAIAILIAVLADARGLTRTARHRAFFVALVTLATVGLGGLWEVAEWLWDRLGTAQRNTILGKPDTMLDLVVDTGGALLGSLLSVAVLAPRARRDHARRTIGTPARRLEPLDTTGRGDAPA